ncbi:MAG: UDP-3-O-(3-hydroxymyristoyl)glucosamine N-acyltransferase [Flavobacteriaceae bacterium]
MKFKASQIAEILEGEIVGNPDVEVSNLSKIEEGENGSLTFLSNLKYQNFLYTTNASVVIVNSDFKPQSSVKSTLIKVKDAGVAFSTLLTYYNQAKLHKVGIETPSFISKSVIQGNDIYIGAFAYIGNNVVLGDNVKIYPNSYVGDNVSIGDDTTLFAGVKIYADTVIGKNCNINSGAVIGADGFGFLPDENGEFQKTPQIGNVIVEDNVEIGSNTTVDCATLGSTIIRKGVKLDNLIQIAHNVEVGRNTVIAAQTGVAGSAKIGENCLIGGQVAIVGHIKIGNNVRVQALSGVAGNVKDNAVVQGSRAFNYNDYNRSYVHFKNLPKIVNRISDLEKK